MHSCSLEVVDQPRPLQEFLPLQEDSDVLQALVPLQELTPPHFTFPSARAVAVAPAANKAAAVAATRVNLPMTTPIPTAAKMPRHDANGKPSNPTTARLDDHPCVKRAGDSAFSVTPSPAMSPGSPLLRARLAASRPAAAPVWMP